MNEITPPSSITKDCSADDSYLEIHSNNDNQINEKENCDIVDIDQNQESKYNEIQIMSISSSMQDDQLAVIRSNKSFTSVSSDYLTLNAVTSLNAESASFALLSRRESSLENLAEDENGLHNVSMSPYSDANTNTVMEKSIINDNTNNLPKKTESSRFRRTISSLLSCCTQKSRRSHYPCKSDVITTTINIGGDSDANIVPDKCFEHKQSASRPQDNEHISFNCLKLKKFLDIFDESESVGKRVQQPTKSDTSRPVLATVVCRDGDKSDTPSKNMKTNDTFQSENGGANLTRPVLLGTIKPADQSKKCFIIDLDETLVHSSFKMVEKADFKVGVDIEGTVHTVYVLKRPYVDVFLQKMGRIFECVLFTASLAKYADPVTDFLDKWRVFRWRLFRESCVFHRGNYVKDLSMLGRHTGQVAILDNSPASYMFHPDNAVQITSWFDDPRDTALLDLIPYFEQLAAAPSVPPFLASVKPPQRATVPVSVMLTAPASMSLQPISQLQQQQSSSPITSVDSANAASADLHSSETSAITCQPPHSTTALYINDNNIQSPFSRSLRSLSSISSKSLPSIFSVECVVTAFKSSRSETQLSTILSSVLIDPSIIKEVGTLNPMISKSTSHLPTIPIYNDNCDIPQSNIVISRSFPALTTMSNIFVPFIHLTPNESPYKKQDISININSSNDDSKTRSIIPRSASLSLHISPSDVNHRSSSFCDNRTTELHKFLLAD